MVKFLAITPELHISNNVAVVGNSPKILTKNLGAEIDSHQDVIRFNGALVDEYKSDVGSKTTFQFIGIDLAYLFSPPYKRPSKDEEQNEKIRLFNAGIIADKFSNANIVTFHPNDSERNNNNKQYKSSIYLASVSQDLSIYFFEENGVGSSMFFFTANKDLESLGLESRLNFGGPRTGFKTVLRLVLSGVKPDLYGFDIDPNIEFAKHYYDDITNEKISEYKPHDIQGEMITLVEMHQKGLVNIVC
ncbi:glycosyltransferase family 29 protein [Rheinheimera sp. UJ51]|uniref:glycosyltransferase family 29 protein n=1 Tax=Rheinheimera sp. UJ51 TaxID=2892446 RepID=UPI001E546D81|nr:glycosyltransferase family 29 protein [Rheinheimera sp. UJ51]MCC5450291.1 glycosyltransferase family 29 protein [Rheinheimera sp. UJ51]